MASFTIECPYCRHAFPGDELAHGLRMACPACHQVLQVPRKETEDTPKLARILGTVVERAAADEVSEAGEQDVFLFHPAARAFWAPILLGILLVAAFGLGLLILAWVWYRIHSVQYRLTSQRLFVRRGLIARKVEEVELFRVKDVKMDQSLLQRILNVGAITVLSTDDSMPEIKMIGVPDPVNVKETLRTQYRAARKREGVQAAELIPS